jgi:3-polyprenyl-4-hydroxybenzoate decarboxylase
VVAVAWSFLFVLGGAMEIVAVPGALAVGIGVRLLQVLEGCDEHRVHLSLPREGKGVMEHDLYQRWSAA